VQLPRDRDVQRNLITGHAGNASDASTADRACQRADAWADLPPGHHQARDEPGCAAHLGRADRHSVQVSGRCFLRWSRSWAAPRRRQAPRSQGRPGQGCGGLARPGGVTGSNCGSPDNGDHRCG
jgi:hypothetical protein